MEGYAVLMLCFAGFLFIYAGILAKTRNFKLIPRHDAVKTKDKKEYTEKVAKATALAALAPLASALVARITDAALPSLLMLLGGFVLTIWLGARLANRR